MLNIYIHHQFHPTRCGVCYTVFRQTIVLLAQQIYASYNVVTQVVK